MLIVFRVLLGLLNIYEFLILIWCILSWFPHRAGTFFDDFCQAINSLVAPFINLFRRFIPPFGGIDCSPMIAILALWLLEVVLTNLFSLFV